VDAKAAIVVELEVNGFSGLAKRIDEPFDELRRVLNGGGSQSDRFRLRNAYRSLTAILRAIHRIRGRLSDGSSDFPSRIHNPDSVLEPGETTSRQRSENTQHKESSIVHPVSGVLVDDESQPPAITSIEMTVLRALAVFDPSQLASSKRIEDAIPPPARLSSRTINPIVRHLIELRLAERPQGARSGARLTMAGRRLCRKSSG